MPRVGKNIYKRSDGRWEGRYVRERINGKARYGSVYAHTYAEVKSKLDAAKREAEKKLAPKLKAGNVRDLSNIWLSEASAELKESSVVKYEDLLRLYIIPAFGDKDLSDITNDEIITFAGDIRSSGGKNNEGLAPSTVSEILTLMNALRLYAVKRDLSVRFTLECVTVKQEQKEIRVFSRQEEKKLIDYLKAHMDHTAIGILVCLYTGIRVGELCALKHEDINLPEGTMRIAKTMQRLRVRGSADRKTEVKILVPKSSHSIRVIPLPDVLIEILRDVQAETGAFLLTGSVKRMVEPRTMQKRFKKILAKCGIADANFHATRHTFATRCVELGFDIKSLSEILGHASVTITMNKYVHPTMEHKAAHMNRFSNLFSEE